MSASPPVPDELASTLVKARATLGITQNELHKRTGISREAIKGYESGRNKPGARELKLLCEALHVSPNLLLFGTESPFDSKGELYEMMHANGQLDWTRFAVLFSLLTIKEKSSILFILESILLGRYSQEDINNKLKSMELMSLLSTQMMERAQLVKEGKLKPEEAGNFTDFVEKLDIYIKAREEELKKPR